MLELAIFLCFLSLNSVAQVPAEHIKAKHVEPGRWAWSFQGYGNISTNKGTRRKYRSGLGGGTRGGYGFWQGLSVEGEFEYDVLYRDGGVAKNQGNKNLYSLDTGLRYTAYLLQDDISGYVSPLFGLTYDFTKGQDSTFNLNYVLITGLDFNLTENLSFGPLFKYRHVVEASEIQYVTIGAEFTYLFN